LVPQGCQLLIGADYALLRPEFARLRPEALAERERRAGRVERVLVSFGNSDRCGLSVMALEALERLDGDLSIEVVAGAHNPDLARLGDMAAQSKHRVNVRARTDDMPHLMAWADLSVGAGGTTSWERCCLGLPTVMLELAENQKFAAAGLAASGSVVNLGWYEGVGVDLLAARLRQLVAEPEWVLAISHRAGSICDGQGAERVAGILSDWRSG
jgi:spore coat polysaccharide biosynthesis predicted glycosyltransferase SpsG